MAQIQKSNATHQIKNVYNLYVNYDNILTKFLLDQQQKEHLKYLKNSTVIYQRINCCNLYHKCIDERNRNDSKTYLDAENISNNITLQQNNPLMLNERVQKVNLNSFSHCLNNEHHYHNEKQLTNHNNKDNNNDINYNNDRSTIYDKRNVISKCTNVMKPLEQNCVCIKRNEPVILFNAHLTEDSPGITKMGTGSTMKKSAPPKSPKYNRSSNDYLYLLKYLLQYILIVNCLVYFVDNNLLTSKIGAFGMQSNHTVTSTAPVASTSIASTHLLSSVNNRSHSDLVNAKNRKIGNSTQKIADSFTLMDLGNMKQQMNHYNYKNGNGPEPHTVSHHHQQHQIHQQHSQQKNHEHELLLSPGVAMASEHNDQTATMATTTTTTTTTASTTLKNEDSSDEFFGCTSCQLREQLKAQNLQSIKMHILARLAMSQPPNITTRPPISEHLIQTFYTQNGFRYIRVKNNYNGNDMNDMQGDDPLAATHSHDTDNNQSFETNDQQEQSVVQQHHHHHRPPSSNRHDQGSTHLHLHPHHHHNSHHTGAGGRHSNVNNMKIFDSIDGNEQVSHKYHPENEYTDEYDYYSSNDRGIIYNMDYYDEAPEDDEDSEEGFYSITDSIYSFPKLSKARHRGDILEFTIKDNNHLAVSGATFNLFVHGEDWIRENDPNLLKEHHIADDTSHTGNADNLNGYSASGGFFYKQNNNNKNLNSNHLSISINRFVHRNPAQQSQQQQQDHQIPQQQQQQQRYTRTDSNYIGGIPKGMGDWIQFNITLMVNNWMQQQRHQSFDSSLEIVQEVVVKTFEPWMRQLLVLDTNSQDGPYIEIQTRDIRKHRSKRHLAKDCRENEKQTRCCRFPLRVDFRKFGWDWIIAPDVYEAYYCAGDCPIGFLPKHPHSYIYSLSSSFSTCCSPRKLSSLSLLYFDENKQVIHSIIPNMAVDKCGCS